MGKVKGYWFQISSLTLLFFILQAHNNVCAQSALPSTTLSRGYRTPMIAKPVKGIPFQYQCNPPKGVTVDCPGAVDGNSYCASPPCTDLSQLSGTGHDDPSKCGTNVSCRDKLQEGMQQGLDLAGNYFTTVNSNGLMDCVVPGTNQTATFQSRPELAGLWLNGLHYLAWSKTGADFGGPQVKKLSSQMLVQVANLIYQKWVWGPPQTNDPCVVAPYFSTTSAINLGWGNLNPQVDSGIAKFCSGSSFGASYYNSTSVNGLGIFCCYLAAQTQWPHLLYNPAMMVPPVDTPCEVEQVAQGTPPY